jgi:hypothetical protein
MKEVEEFLRAGRKGEAANRVRGVRATVRSAQGDQALNVEGEHQRGFIVRLARHNNANVSRSARAVSPTDADQRCALPRDTLSDSPRHARRLAKF